jgi:four helix bundle protein
VARVRNHTELLAYQKSYRLVLEIYKITARFPASEQFGLTSQMRRSAVSFPSNIAEGWARGSREYVQFLRIASGSAAELQTQLSIARDLGYCGAQKFSEAMPLLEEVLKLLRGYLAKVAPQSNGLREDSPFYRLDDN